MFNQKRSSTSKHDSIYSTKELFQKACDLLHPFLREWSKFNIVDFSAGDDLFCETMRENFGKRIAKTWSFDLVPTAQSVKQVSWFDINTLPGIRKYPHKMIIGFNPPFGYRNAFALDFIMHATDFCPDLIISVVPRALKDTELDEYVTSHCELLDPFKSFRNRGAIYGTYLKIWTRKEGLVHERSKKRRKKANIPQGMRMITNHRDNVVVWHTQNTLFIRRSGWKPGLKIVYCDSENKLHMVDPSRTYHSDNVNSETINNAITLYNAYTITDKTLVWWKSESVEETLYAIWDRINELKIDRNESMMPYIKAPVLWDAILPSLHIKTSEQE